MRNWKTEEHPYNQKNIEQGTRNIEPKNRLPAMEYRTKKRVELGGSGQQCLKQDKGIKH